MDYGVQIRFINDLHDTGGAPPDKSKGSNAVSPHPASKYGVAVRVQGISGQPYVVLNDGAKGDSYGVQLNTPATGPPTPSSSYKSAPKSNGTAESMTPHAAGASHAHSPEDEDGEIYRSPLRRPPGDGQAGTHGEEEARTAEPQAKAAAGEAQKERDDGTSEEEYNEAGLKPVKVMNAAGPRGFKQNGLTASPSKYADKQLPESPTEPRASTDEKPIDTNSLAPINKLINKFNNRTPGGTPQTRGRSGARQQLRFEERKRSKSLEARKETSRPSLPSPTFNPYGSLLSSDVSSRDLAATPEAPQMSFTSRAKYGAKERSSGIGQKPVRSSKMVVLVPLSVFFSPNVSFFPLPGDTAEDPKICRRWGEGSRQTSSLQRCQRRVSKSLGSDSPNMSSTQE